METEDQQLSSIVGVLDVQGFFIGGKYFVREIAFASDRLNIRYDVSTGINSASLSRADRRTAAFLTKHQHGLDFNPSGAALKQEAVFEVFDTILAVFARSENAKFAIRNLQLAQLLDRHGIAYVDLITLGCPTTTIAYARNHVSLPCSLHPQDRKYRCAQSKSQYYYKWLKMYIASNKTLCCHNHVAQRGQCD